MNKEVLILMKHRTNNYTNTKKNEDFKKRNTMMIKVIRIEAKDLLNTKIQKNNVNLEIKTRKKLNNKKTKKTGKE